MRVNFGFPKRNRSQRGTVPTSTSTGTGTAAETSTAVVARHVVGQPAQRGEVLRWPHRTLVAGVTVNLTDHSILLFSYLCKPEESRVRKGGWYASVSAPQASDDRTGPPPSCPSFPSHPRSAAVIRGAAGHSGCLWQLNSRIQRRYPVHVAVGTQRTIPKPESRARTLSTIQTNIEHNTELVGLNLPSRENGRKGRRKQRMPYAHHSGAKSW